MTTVLSEVEELPVGAMYEPPQITKIPIRWRHDWEWGRPRRYLLLGLAESGKSNLNETFACYHPKKLDIFGSRDNENLLWCRRGSPVDDILLVTGPNTDINCSWDTKRVDDVTIRDIEAHEATVTCDAFHSSQPVKFMSIAKLSDLLYMRKTWRKGDIIYLLLRETMSLLYSRIALGEGEKEAKAALLTFLRELRHFGVSFGADSLRWTGIELELRDLADVTIFKQLGEKGLPKDKRYLYKYIQPKTFAHMRPHEFVGLSKTGAIFYGQSPLLKFHKEEGVDLLRELSIRVTHGEEIVETVQGKIGDREHEHLLRVYLEQESMENAARITGRGQITISRHVRYHNKQIVQTGRCERCARIGSDLTERMVQVR